MSNLIISGLTAYTAQGVLNNARIEIANGSIHSLHAQAVSESKTLHFPPTYSLVPGMIDLHIHGAKGRDVMDASLDSLAEMSKALAAEGVTGFLATTMTASPYDIETVLGSVRDFMHEPTLGAKIVGVHLEGPFISPEKVGAQSREKLLPLKIDYIKRWQALSDHLIKIVTFAPELPGSSDFIRYLRQHNIIASMGHTHASFTECMTAIDAGCSHATHLFNAMRGMHQRDPGTVGAVLLSDHVTAEIIVDGVHVHPVMLQLALRLKGPNKLVLVTDAMRAKCLSDGKYDLGGQSVEVKNHVARLSDGTLAGSTLTMPAALKNMMKFTGLDFSYAIKLVTENPAKILGLFDKIGSIAVGKIADLVVLNENLDVVLTLIQGHICFENSDGF
jgi:N-acetylglucosamine-6-phosphate deacetylase